MPAAKCGLVKMLGCVQQPVDSVSEPTQRAQLGQVFQHLSQVVTIRLAQVLAPLHDQVSMLEDEGRLLLQRRPAALGSGLWPALLLRPRFFLGPLSPRRLMAVRSRRTASRMSLLMFLTMWKTHN